jgi:hypothetical protein
MVSGPLDRLYAARPWDLALDCGIQQTGLGRNDKLVSVNRKRVAQLLLVCAPAGFGKRALLADWMRTEAVTRAWQLGVIP